jgi:D-glycero-alpha-D-manno-heptose-7-phosphate kinase
MIVVQVPLRISFFGGGTDLRSFYQHEPGGVLSSAIDKCVYSIVKERFDDLIYVNYSRKEIVSTVDELQHELVREAMRLAGIPKGVEITTLSDVPAEGTGLGSSSSITVALLLALYSYKGVLCSARQLAEEACRIEIDILDKPIGKQDQYIAAFGNMHSFTFCPDESVLVERLELEDDTKARLNSRLMLFYTNRTRSADTILREQNANTPAMLDILRAMKSLVKTGKEALQAGDLDKFGHLLHEGWMLKRDVASGITDREIDAMYERARAAGALGGKIVGAGGGGFLLLYCPLGSQEAVTNALQGYRELRFSLERDGAKVIFNSRR